ncbi:MAG: hypothetical protein RLZZ524_832, partial [Pseudomonadota bacterium]
QLVASGGGYEDWDISPSNEPTNSFNTNELYVTASGWNGGSGFAIPANAIVVGVVVRFDIQQITYLQSPQLAAYITHIADDFASNERLQPIDELIVFGAPPAPIGWSTPAVGGPFDTMAPQSADEWLGSPISEALSTPAYWNNPVGNNIRAVARIRNIGDTRVRVRIAEAEMTVYYVEQPVAGLPYAAGRIASVSGVTGTLRKGKRLGGTINAVAGFQTGSVFLGARRTLPSSSNPSPIASAVGFRFAALTNNVGGTVKNVYMNGRVSAESAVRGTLGRGPKVFRGLWVQGTSAVTGRIGKGRRLPQRKIEVDSKVVGSVIRRALIAGTAAAASAVSGAMRKLRRVAGTVGAASTVVGALVARRGVYGAIAAESKVVGTLNRIILLNGGAPGIVAAQSGVVGVLRRVRPLPAPSVIAGQSAVTGELLNSFLSPQDDNVHRVPSKARGHVVPSRTRKHEVP